MTRDLAHLLALLVLGTAWPLVHVRLAMRTMQARALTRRQRWLAWLPPLTPFIGWAARERFWSVAWCLTAGAYAVLYALA